VDSSSPLEGPGPHRPARGLLLLAAGLALAGLTYGFSAYPLLEPDEGRNAEVAREMAARNDYVLPRLNGLPYVDKPVLSFAASAVTMKLLGPTETAARLPSLVFTLLTVALVAWFARRLLDGTAAWTAAIATAATPFTLAYARTVIFDAALTLWVVAALVAFYLAVEAGRDSRRTAVWWSAAAWVAIGLGILTKGPVALAVPLLVALPYAVWRRQVAAVLDPLGMLALLALVLPWVFAVTRQVPDFLHYVLLVETADRLAGSGLGRTEPWWYFLPITVGAALPWSLVALGGVRKPRLAAADHRLVFLLLWVAVPVVFFTLSQSKRPQYILPVVPAFGLLVALLWDRAGGRLPGARLAGAALALLGATLLLGGSHLAPLVRSSAAAAAVIPRTALWLGALCAVSGAAAWRFATRRDGVLLAFVLPVAAIPIIAMPLMRVIGSERSSRALADAVAPFVPEHAEIVAIAAYPLSLPFYLRRTLTLATADGRELTSNYVVRQLAALRQAPGSTLRPADWWEGALVQCDRPRLFVVGADDWVRRQRLATRLALRGESRKVAIYGPCSAGEYARRP
jgi:4-amino-4-deoxy-L-arabinose transferase-like glycosyltransferase